MLGRSAEGEPPSGASWGMKEIIARDTRRDRVQCLTAAIINTFSLAEERSYKG